jgi:hypothetical protein
MIFPQALSAFHRKVEVRVRELTVGVVDELKRSIVEGSPITSAPGQPVDTGALRASWTADFPSQNEARIYTQMRYANIIEDGESEGHPITLRSEVGGFHSVKLTVANADKVVEHVRKQVTAGD